MQCGGVTDDASSNYEVVQFCTFNYFVVGEVPVPPALRLTSRVIRIQSLRDLAGKNVGYRKTFEVSDTSKPLNYIHDSN